MSFFFYNINGNNTTNNTAGESKVDFPFVQ